MTKERIVEKLEKYKQALARLEEALTKKNRISLCTMLQSRGLNLLMNWPGN